GARTRISRAAASLSAREHGNKRFGCISPMATCLEEAGIGRVPVAGQGHALGIDRPLIRLLLCAEITARSPRAISAQHSWEDRMKTKAYITICMALAASP